MHISTITITAIAIILITGSWAEAKNLDKGGSFINYHAPKQKSKDYYIVVKEGSGDQCSIVAGAWGENPAGMVGTSPYATRQYAKAALKNFPQCTGGEAEESWGDTKTKTKSKSKSGKSKSDKTQGASEVAPTDIKQP